MPFRPSDRGRPSGESPAAPAIARLLAELNAGLQHGFFEYQLTCEIIGQGRRRLTIHAGKTYQFTIPASECVHVVSGPTDDSPKRSDENAD
jgi:hypothetical protein